MVAEKGETSWSFVTYESILDTAKDTAKAALATALLSYSSDDYTPEDWIVLNGFKTNGDIAITSAESLEAVELAKDTAINGMDNVKTIAETLAQAKLDAKDELQEEFEGYKQSDYTPENWLILVGYKTAGDTAIDLAEDLDAVELAKNTAIDNMGLPEISPEALAVVKTNATDTLTNAYNEYLLDRANYTDPNWDILFEAYEDGLEEIDSVEYEDGVYSALERALEAMSDVETIE